MRKEKGEKLLVSNQDTFRLDEGVAIGVNYLVCGDEINRELLKPGDIVLNLDGVYCLTPCTFSEVKEVFDISPDQMIRLSKLSVIKEEKFVIERLQELFKHLISEFVGYKTDEWIQIPFALTQAQIAGLVSSTRITVTNNIKKLELDNFLKRDKRKILINSKFINSSI
ncbi:MAG: helix-turn-helix domain-containing protein [Rivularia sp. (in: cyanobacteria)]